MFYCFISYTINFFDCTNEIIIITWLIIAEKSCTVTKGSIKTGDINNFTTVEGLRGNTAFGVVWNTTGFERLTKY